MIFISSPYSSNSPATVAYRYDKVMEFTARCLDQGLVAFSPIVYAHLIAKRMVQSHTDAASWAVFNMNMLRRADCVYALCLPGWEQSQGMGLEIKVCQMLAMPVVKYSEDFELLSKEFAAVSVVERF